LILSGANGSAIELCWADGASWGCCGGPEGALLLSRALTRFFCQQTRATPVAFNTTTKQVRSYAADAKAAPTEVSSILEQRIRGVQEETSLAETGRVLSVGYAQHHSYIIHRKGHQELTRAI
jgi:hypothetical protein